MACSLRRGRSWRSGRSGQRWRAAAGSSLARARAAAAPRRGRGDGAEAKPRPSKTRARGRLDSCTVRHGSATALPRLGHGSATARPPARSRRAAANWFMSSVCLFCCVQYMAACMAGAANLARTPLGPSSSAPARAVASSSRARGAPPGAPPASRPGAGWPARAARHARADPRMLAGARHARTLWRRQTLSCERSLGDDGESAAERSGLWRLPVTVSKKRSPNRS